MLRVTKDKQVCTSGCRNDRETQIEPRRKRLDNEARIARPKPGHRLRQPIESVDAATADMACG